MVLTIDSEHWVKNMLNTVYEADFPTFLPELHFLRGNYRAKYIKQLANLWGKQICQYLDIFMEDTVPVPTTHIKLQL